MSDAPSGNGRFHDEDPDIDDDLDDDAPLGVDEAEAAAAIAAEEADETLDERVETVVEELDGVERRRDGESVTYLVEGRVFAVLGADALETGLDPVVAGAALKTSGTTASPRGKGWIRFQPADVDRFALDRAEAWVRSAYRRAAG